MSDALTSKDDVIDEWRRKPEALITLKACAAHALLTGHMRIEV